MTTAPEPPTNDQEFLGLTDIIATAQQQLADLRAQLDQALIQAREPFADQIEALDAQIKLLSKLGRAYCKQARTRLIPKGQQSAEGRLSRYGFHKSPPTVELRSGTKTQDVIAALEETDRKDYLNIKITKTLNKSALLALTDTQLAELGLIRRTKETFFVEPKQDGGTRATA